MESKSRMASSQVHETAAGGRRKAAKERRRQQLIEATIDSIAKRGFADTTLAHVSQTAGLSQGIVNLHFTNKENLLIETLRFLRDDFRQAWGHAIEQAGDSPGEKLAALVALDFDPQVCAPRKLAVWFAFQGEAKSRPTYTKICEEHDEEYEGVLIYPIEELVRDGESQSLDARSIAVGLTALSEGLWLDMLMAPKQINRRQARKICFGFLAQFFPAHFSAEDAEAYR